MKFSRKFIQFIHFAVYLEELGVLNLIEIMMNMALLIFAISADLKEAGNLLQKRRLVDFFQTLLLEPALDYLKD